MTKLDQLIINASTRRQLANYLAHPAQALMLTGASGLGLYTIAEALAHQLAGGNTVLLRPSLHKAQKTAIINADDIAYVTSIIYDKRKESLVVVIDDIDQVAPGVSERILKIVEEPVKNVYFIFTTHHPATVPATIMSRSQQIEVAAPEISDCVTLLAYAPEASQSQIKFLAAAYPAQIYRLIRQPKLLTDVAAQAKLAKQFITSNTGERLVLITNIKDRTAATEFCELVVKFLLFAQRTSEHSERLVRQLNLINDVMAYLTASCNLKLALTQLALNL